MGLVVRIVLIALCAVICGCTQRDIPYPDSNPMTINLIFEYEEDATEKPEGVTVIFYPIDSRSKIWRFEIPGGEDGTVEIPYGKYKMIALDNDLPNVYLDNVESFSSIIAGCVPLTEQILRQPGILYSGAINRIELTTCGVNYDTDEGDCKACPYGVIRCRMYDRSIRWIVKVNSVKNLHLLRNATAVVDGVAPEILLSTGEASGNATEFSMTLNAIGSGLEAFGTAFGKPGWSSGKYGMTLNITTTYGKKFSKFFDINNLVYLNYSNRTVVIEIDEIEIPVDGHPADDDDVGINVGVSGWQEINIDLYS